MSHRAQAPLVVVGGGIAGVSAALTVRDHDDGPILLVSADRALPYRRSPLSTTYLLGETTRAGLAIHDGATYRRLGIDLLLGANAGPIDTKTQQLDVRGHGTIRYRGLVLATGATPIATADRDGVVVVHDVEGADRLRALIDRARRRIVVVGAGMTGTEIASTLVALGHDVVVIDGRAGSANGARGGPELRIGARAIAIEGHRRAEAVRVATGERIEAEIVVLATGVRPERVAPLGPGVVAVPPSGTDSLARRRGARAARALVGAPADDRSVGEDVPRTTREGAGTAVIHNTRW